MAQSRNQIVKFSNQKEKQKPIVNLNKRHVMNGITAEGCFSMLLLHKYGIIIGKSTRIACLQEEFVLSVY